MNIKVLGGLLSGAIIGSGITYTVVNKKLKETQYLLDKQSIDASKRFEKYEKEISSIIEDRTEVVSNYESELERFKSACKTIASCNRNCGNLYTKTIELYRQLLNPDMLADITSIDDIDYRDECLCVIDTAATNISGLVSTVNFTDISTKEVDKVIEDMTDILTDATDEIKKCITEYQESCTDDDDDTEDIENVSLVSPARVIIKSLDGSTKIFNAEPDEGFEVIDGSDIENNDYCIDAQNIPELYTFLFNSIRDQLTYHYVSEINEETFNTLLEDMTITVSLSFVDDDSLDMIITAVNAVVPFELFGESLGDKQYKIYSIEGGELDLGNALDYFRSNRSNNNNEDRKTDSDEGSIKTETGIKNEETVVKTNSDNMPISFDSAISDEAVKFITETIGINRDSLVSFVGNLKILMVVNPEAGNAIYDAYKSTVEEIQILIHEDKLTTDEIANYYNSIRAIMTNMKKNYGSSIKAYKHRMRDSASNAE